jgi:hypothetical protein
MGNIELIAILGDIARRRLHVAQRLQLLLGECILQLGPAVGVRAAELAEHALQLLHDGVLLQRGGRGLDNGKYMLENEQHFAQSRPTNRCSTTAR